MRPSTLPLAAALLALSMPALSFAADVHVRVDPSAPHANPGQENLTTFPTIVNALDHHPFATPNPDGTPGRVFIEIVPGVYHERVIVTQNHDNITLIGLGKSPADVVITNSLNARTAGGTFFTQTVEINGTGFEADNITFENAAGNTGQAVAVADRGDRSIFKHCRFLGHQDTLFADYGRQYYVDSYVEGGVDYIFGNAAAVFDSDELHSNGPGFITAQSRTSPDQPTGYVILNSRVTASREDASAPSPTTSSAGPATPERPARPLQIGLGRPWRTYSRVIYIDTSLPAEMMPAGWNNWGSVRNESTAYYAESGSTGPGASPSTRVPWSHQLTAAQVKQYLPQNFLAGSDHWNPIAEAAKLP
ncbi:MAG TPA: pectinesterase family protein [Acidobacteriaceae bacterium]|nr:pectinesterase family protein [Acidobacteriaceae bacterium]